MTDPNSGRFGWLTDVHLNFVNLPAREAFAERLAADRLHGLLITGDISEADDVAWQLQQLSHEAACPVYFVLGNHDFYRGSIARVRKTMEDLCTQHSHLHYLTGRSPIRLSDQWILCGDDGWADARVGNFYRSNVRMNDFRLIEELTELDSRARCRFLRREGTASALRLGRQLAAAASLSDRIVVLTHIPPFRESCWYDGGHSDDNWAPFFVCHAVGWILQRFCRLHPQHEVLVLCGHTHHAGRSRIAQNLTVWTGAAEYGSPRMSQIIEFDCLQYPENDWTFSP